MKNPIVLTGLLAALLCGCADVKITDYKRPDAPAKTAWSQPAEPAVSAAARSRRAGGRSSAIPHSIRS